jgi:nucleoside transporter
MNTTARNKLSVMMFLQIFIWGAWLPLMESYLSKDAAHGGLGFSGLETAWIMNAFALASFTAMFFSTQFADRNFAAEKFLAVSHLIGGVAILSLFWVTEFWPFFFLMLVYSLFYVPTISISNSIAFSNLKDAQRDFGLVRLWGTIGWIAASWPFVFILVDWVKIPALGDVSFTTWLGDVLDAKNSLQGEALRDGKRYIFVAAGLSSLILAVNSLFLPHTPPRPAAQASESFAWLEAMKLLRQPFVLVLFIVTFFDAAIHQGYFVLTGKFLETVGIPSNWVMPAMSVGQIAEIGTMAFLGVCLKSMGWKTTMIVGVLGHALRFSVFALAPEPWLAVGVNIIHGICYAFFFATVYIFVDEFFPKDARSSAQGLFNFMILGLGPFVGTFVWKWLEDYYTMATGDVKVVDYRSLFLVLAGVGLFAALLLLLFFNPPQSATARAEVRKGVAGEALPKPLPTGIKG